MTFNEVCDKLAQLDELHLLEILDISSDELVDRFQDKIESKLDYFKQDLEDDSDWDEST